MRKLSEIYYDEFAFAEVWYDRQLRCWVVTYRNGKGDDVASDWLYTKREAIACAQAMGKPYALTTPEGGRPRGYNAAPISAYKI